MDELNGKVAVVTGGASGIGKAVALALAAESMKVVVADIEQPPLDSTVAEIEMAGGVRQVWSATFRTGNRWTG
ncbi:MAG: SDR family NAD(P)-dependent oxidoreductase [Acidimicrobiaceae bacterium]|nr:SDR family NAD(P)-dependent oxidoreductase [Acidimicrobiaceae bacterium]